MKKQDVLKMVMQVKLDAHFAESLAHNMSENSVYSREEANALLTKCRKAYHSAQELYNVLGGTPEPTRPIETLKSTTA